MLVTVYEVLRSGSHERYLSLEMSVDYAYWFCSLGGTDVRLRVCSEQVLVCDGLRWLRGNDAALLGGRYDFSPGGVSGPDRQVSWQTIVNSDRIRETAAGVLGLAEADKPTLENLLNMDGRLLSELAARLAGRRLLFEEVRRLSTDMGLLSSETDDRFWTVLQLLIVRGDIRLDEGMSLTDTFLDRQLAWLQRRSGGSSYRKRLRCGRCDSGADKHYTSHCAVCGRDCVYCEACLQMGRVRECSCFIVGCRVADQPGDADARRAVDEAEVDQMLKRWRLSPAQEAASREALAFAASPAKREGEQFLIWAVTGAGKTEMVYPLVAFMLRAGGRVLLTAPRRDVVLELAPRLAKAFPESEVVALYGGSEHRWEIGDITVATTHQLLRLERCFDLVVLDELDAYPYHNNPMLAFAARRACKTRGKTVLLTATPPREQQLAMRQRSLPHAMVPVRFHRHPLPEPRILRYRGIHAALGAGRLPSGLRAALAESLQRGAQIFVFVPRIEHVEPLTRLLRMACAGAVDAAAVDGTSSRDADRANRVRRFRSGEIRILVTTTILERGVTIPRSDVFVLDADAALFDEAALVQMAGRAGRSADDPCGRVYYVARERTDGQLQAVRHIRAMNALARKRGLLLSAAAASLGGEADA